MHYPTLFHIALKIKTLLGVKEPGFMMVIKIYELDKQEKKEELEMLTRHKARKLYSLRYGQL